VGYGILKYLSSDKELSSSSVNPSLSFNYLGQWDNTLSQVGPFTPAYESAGNSIAKDNASTYFLNINSEIRQGIFHASFDYSVNHYNQETIKTVANLFINRLSQLVEYCSQEENFGYTLSDFSISNLDETALTNRIKAIKVKAIKEFL